MPKAQWGNVGLPSLTEMMDARFLMTLSKEQLKAVDERAAAASLTRNEYVRKALRHFAICHTE